MIWDHKEVYGRKWTLQRHQLFYFLKYIAQKHFKLKLHNLIRPVFRMIKDVSSVNIHLEFAWIWNISFV